MPNAKNETPVNPLGNAPFDTSASTAGDEAALQAIEALEAETNVVSGLDPIQELPNIPQAPIPMTTVVPTPIPVLPPQPVSPISMPPPTMPSTAVITEPLVPTTPTPMASAPLEQPISLPNSASRSIAQSLNEETPVVVNGFQPFAHQKRPSKKLTIIIVIILVTVLLGGGGYFGWQYLQTQNKPTATTQTNAPVTETTPTITDTEASVNQTITDMQKNLDAVTDSEYADTTFSDTTLYQ